MLRLRMAQVMPLRGGEEKDRGYAALRSLGAAMEQKSLLAPVSLELQGLSHFRHQALPCNPAKHRNASSRTPPHHDVLKLQQDRHAVT